MSAVLSARIAAVQQPFLCVPFAAVVQQPFLCIPFAAAVQQPFPLHTKNPLSQDRRTGKMLSKIRLLISIDFYLPFPKWPPPEL